ncbi:MAG: 1-acyl-sn-glycerol-3-phosphate acyltransferase [Bacteroidia bacterium]
MLIWICRFFFWIKGWKLNPVVPEGARNSVMLAMPHTSNWDFILAIAAMRRLGLNARFTIKKEHNRFPYGKMIENAGALWIDRSPKIPGEKRPSMVDLMIGFGKQFKGQPFVLMITPEGTRSPNDHWKTGFYHVAMNTEMPISLAYLDYKKKEAGVGMSFMPTGDKKVDMKKIIDFYDDVSAKYPEKYLPDVSHLEN